MTKIIKKSHDLSSYSLTDLCKEFRALELQAIECVSTHCQDFKDMENSADLQRLVVDAKNCIIQIGAQEGEEKELRKILERYKVKINAILNIS